MRESLGTAGCVLNNAITSLFGYRCNQLPLIERSAQWLSGPSLPCLSPPDRSMVTVPDSNDVRTRSTFIQLLA